MGNAIRSLCVLSLGSIALIGCSSGQQTYTTNWKADAPANNNVDHRYVETVSNVSTYAYEYFPQQEVYFAPDRNLFFWQSNGAWTSGPQLPGHLNVNPNNSVQIPLHTDTPWEVHASVTSVYPRSWRSAAQNVW